LEQSSAVEKFFHQLSMRFTTMKVSKCSSSRHRWHCISNT
jgi:hypothetical protein